MSDPKTPQQGAFYTVVYGDTIRNIERSAYGRTVGQVAAANPALLANRQKSDEGIPFIYPGDRLWIPPYRNRYNNEKITADFDTQVTITLNGRKLPGAIASSMSRAMNTIASGFVFDIPFDYRDRDMVDLLRPYTWYPATLTIGTDLYITALAAKWTYKQDGDSTIATIEARTMPGEMLECMGMRKSLAFSSGLNLIDICKEVVKPYGIRCFSANGTGGEVTASTEGGDTFGRIEQDETETDADFLQRLAAAKGFLITSMPDGNLLICRANTGDKPAVALVQGKAPVKSVGAVFDGQKRFSTWKGYVEESGVTSKPVTLTDSTVPRNRTFCFKATDSEEGNLKTAVKWRMAKSFNDALSIPVVVEGWRNTEGELWSENMKVTLLAPGAFIFKETQFIIESVELTKDESGGDQASLSLVLPDSYTTTMPKPPFPWEDYYTEPK
jgi:prophage tail gpP-like protein